MPTQTSLKFPQMLEDFLSLPRQWPQMLQEGHRTGYNSYPASFTLSSAGGLATSSIEVPGLETDTGPETKKRLALLFQ